MENLGTTLGAGGTSRTLRAGTRGSTLALWQTEHVIGKLKEQFPRLDCRVEVISSKGDRDQITPLPALGGKGLFTAELEAGLYAGEMDFAVHSLKDLPIQDPPGLITAAIFARSEPRDVLVGRDGLTLSQLPPNAVIGTSSTRRGAQLLARRPDLLVRTIRGNVDTRLRKLDEGLYDAIILAGAGIERMELSHRVTEWLPVSWFSPAPGQGALAVQCRSDDEEVKSLLGVLHSQELAECVAAERGFLAALGGGCSEPVGAFAEPVPVEEESKNATLKLTAWYSTPDGQCHWQKTVYGSDGKALAAQAAQEAMAHLAKTAWSKPSGVGQNNSHSNIFVPFETRPKVVLTRSVFGDNDACRLLLAAGFQPLVAPLIEMQAELSPTALKARVGTPESYDWLIFTSANAVRIFSALWARQGGNSRDFNRVAVAAVGPVTAQAATDAGFEVAFVPETFSAEGLEKNAEQFAAKRLLLPRSALGNPALVEGLQATGAQVNEIALYRPSTVALDEHTLRTLSRGFEVLTFASGSAVQAFAAEMTRHPFLARLVAKSKIASIGPQTSQAIRDADLPVHTESPDHTMPGLVRNIAEGLGFGSHTPVTSHK